MVPARTSRLEAPDDLTRPVGVVILRSRRRTRSPREQLAEVLLSSLTALLVGFVFACLRHAVQISPIQFLP